MRVLKQKSIEAESQEQEFKIELAFETVILMLYTSLLTL